MTPEFSRPEPLDTIGEGDREVAIEADAAERAGLAARFGLVSIEALSARFRVRKAGARVAAEGRVAARVTQACSITGEPIAAVVDEAVSLIFAREGEGADEVELDAGALDVLPIEGDAFGGGSIEGGSIDLGEAAAETVALALDPFPRGPNAAAALREAGVLAEDEVRPTGGLADLGRLLGERS